MLLNYYETCESGRGFLHGALTDHSLTRPVDDKDRDNASVSARNAAGTGYVCPPRTLRAFPDAQRAKPKTPRPGGGLRCRWKDSARQIYEWDYQHGRVELYAQGNHLGE